MTEVRLKVAESGQPADADSFDPGGAVGDVLTKLAPAAPGLPPRFGWQPGGGGLVTQLTNTRFVDVSTTVPLAQQNGTVGAPFNTISQAITALLATGGTVLLVPGDYSGEGALAADGANPFSFVNLAGLQKAPSDTQDYAPCVMPSLTGSASKYVEGCKCNLLLSTGGSIQAVGCNIHNRVEANFDVALWSCSFDRDAAGIAPLVTVHVGIFNAENCRFGNAGDLASLSANRHRMLGCTFGAGTGLIDGPVATVIVEFDDYTNFNYLAQFGPNFGANMQPTVSSLRDNRAALNAAVPALAAGVLDYLDLDVSAAYPGAPLIPLGTPVTVNPNVNLGVAGAGGGFMAQAYMPADNIVRIALVGALAGGPTTFICSFG